MASRFLRLAIAVAVCAIGCLAALPSARGEFDYRSIFVDRFDYSFSESSINSIMENAANQGFQHVIFQVRGRGDAFYNSNFEPRANGLPANFDPLQVAINAAHLRGLKLHAWINSTPMWNTTALNPPAGHIYHNTNPSLRLMDLNGTLEPQQGWSNYSSANPVLPEMHTHLNNVANDIAANYAVDGIHLDYIRYIPGTGNFSRLPHDPTSHAMFNAATGLDASDIANAAAYKTFIAGRITDLVASLKQTVDAAEVTTGRPMDLTASVWRDPDVGRNDYMQDYRTWIEDGLLDVAMPMIYLSASNDHIYFDANLANTLNILAYSGSSTKVAPTLASYLHVNSGGGGVALTLSEMQRAYNGFGQGGADGVGFYDYPAFFNGYTASERQQIKDFFDAIDNPPQPPGPPGPGNVLDDFEANEGHFGWAYNTSPVSQTFGLTPGTSIDRVTEEHQSLGAASQLLNLVSDGSANWQIRHNSGIGVVAQPGGNVQLDPTGWVGFWLKTDEPGLTVRIGIDDPVGNTALERGTVQSVVADNQWHLYQWNFEDANHWDAFAGGADGDIDAANGYITIDSIWFAGSGNAQIYLDTLSHNPNGPLAALIPGDYDRNGVVDAADFNAWRSAFGNTVPLGSSADGNNDGIVGSADYVIWRKAEAMSGSGSGSSIEQNASVPEPAGLLLAAAAFAIASTRRESRAT